jgi:hypothetical protein
MGADSEFDGLSLRQDKTCFLDLDRNERIAWSYVRQRYSRTVST